MTKENLIALIDHNTKIQWKVEKTDVNTILFYKFNQKNQLEKEKFIERIKNKPFKICITNFEMESENCYGVSDIEFENLQSELLNTIYPLSTNLKFIGLTGTNGKTTTVDLVRQLAVLNKKNILTFGTLGCYRNDELVENFNLTTPNLIDAHKFIFDQQEELEVIAFELSSHALEQNRLGHFRFDSIGWTNLTQDHLDYHNTMENYFQAKCKIRELVKKSGLIFLSKALSLEDLEFSFEFEVVSEGENGDHPFFSLSFNKENLDMAYALLKNIFPELKREATKLLPSPGRFDVISHMNSFIAIDYAHTPDALLSICREIKDNFPDHKLKVLFGCGGDRDRGKRSLMAKAVSQYASYGFITSDNPRFENADDIIKDILEGMSIPYEVEVDREQAIGKALNSLDKDILLIAGKGHENYIDIKGKRIFHDDKFCVQKILESQKND